MSFDPTSTPFYKRMTEKVALSPVRECQLVPLDPPVRHTPARVDLVDLIRRTFFDHHGSEKVILRIHTTGYFDALQEPLLSSSPLRTPTLSSIPSAYFGLH